MYYSDFLDAVKIENDNTLTVWKIDILLFKKHCQWTYLSRFCKNEYPSYLKY